MNKLVSLLTCAAAGLALASCGGKATADMTYITTADGSRLFEASPVVYGCPDGLEDRIVTIDPEKEFQTIDGFGCAITGSTSYNLLLMDPSEREALLREIFDPVEGQGSSLVRVSIGSSDFGLDEYTCCDTPGIENFALHEYDRRDVIPILKEIMAINPGLKIVASPWSAPRWMKRSLSDDSDYYSWTGGRLKKECYEDYAQYFVKWIKAMSAEGFNIYAMTIQNEPLNCGNSMSMFMSWDEQRDFIKAALGPAFKEEGIETKILVFDHNYNYDNMPDQFDYPLHIYEDAEASSYVAGSAWHNYGGNPDMLEGIHAAAPEKELYFTEASIGTWNYEFGKCLVYDFESIFIRTMQSWGKGVTLWNLMLDDERGPNRPDGCRTCFGALKLSKSTHQVVERTSHYYNVAHASKVIKPGAVRLESSGVAPEGVMYLTFRNPDGSYAMVASNSGGNDAPMVFTAGKKKASIVIPAHSIASMIWHD